MPARLPTRHAAFLDNPALRRIFDLIEAAGGEVRANGGAVRNALLGEPVNEVDLSTTLTPDKVTECLVSGGLEIVPTGIEHGTVTAISGGEPFEITTLREDIETDGRRAVVRFGTHWKADAERRDFTLNALYCDRSGKLYDPLGGYDDLFFRRIRFIGDPDQRIAEDRLRILRFFRFFAWYGSDRPDAQSLKACVRHRNELSGLSAERVWQEMKRLLSAIDPVKSILWMRTTRILSIVIPETENWGVDLLPALVTSRGHAGELPDPVLRLMAMIPPRSERVDALASRLKLSRAETSRLENWAALPDLPAKFDRQDFAKYLYRHDRQAVIDALWLNKAGLTASNENISEVTQMIAFAQSWTRPELPVQGRDLLEIGYKPGPGLGNMLAQLEERWLASNFQLARLQLLTLAGAKLPDKSQTE